MQKTTPKRPFFLAVIHSFVYAFQGIANALAGRNMCVHLFMSVVAILLGLFFRISLLEWSVIVMCIGMVISAEIVNTAIEELCNALRSDHSLSYEKAGLPKDLAAGAVLILAMASFVVGALIFLPHFFALF